MRGFAFYRDVEYFKEMKLLQCLLECFKDCGFNAHLVRITRPNYDSGLTEQQLKHPSETAMDNYQADCYVINDSTLNNLDAQIPMILKTIGG